MFMCYYISIRLLGTENSKLYMYDKPSRLYQPSHKSRMADCILFEKEINFCTTFMSAIGWSACKSAHIYIYVSIKTFIRFTYM